MQDDESTAEEATSQEEDATSTAGPAEKEGKSAKSKEAGPAR